MKMDRIITLLAVAMSAALTFIYVIPNESSPEGPEFKECRDRAFAHQEKCLYWYSGYQCADVLEREVQICGDVFPSV